VPIEVEVSGTPGSVTVRRNGHRLLGPIASRVRDGTIDDQFIQLTEGVIAAETGNNAVVPGSLIPVIALGLPGSAGAAIIMAALFLHGLRPGPTFMFDNLGMFEYMVAGLVIGAFLMLFVGLALAHVIVHVLLIPRENIMAAVIALAAIGAYASKLQYGDVWMMVAFGAVAYVLRRLEFPLAPLVLGLVLGRMFDDFLRTALIISGGDLSPLYQRPICLVLLVVLVAFFIMSTPGIRRWFGRLLPMPRGVGTEPE